MSVINTNVTSLIAQQNLNASKSDLTTAMERLSSGLRINSAADDAAGQAIANRMSAQITGLSQAQRNANDGISVAQTTEGALNQINDNLQRVRELAVQAQNGTNSDEDLGSIQDEINQRLSEINRISEETSFNGVKVLASDQTLSIQVGANDGETIELDLKKISAETLGLEGFSVSKNALNVSSPIEEVGDGTGAMTAVDVGAAATTLTAQLGTTVNAEDLTVRNVRAADGSSTANYVIEYQGENYAAETTDGTAFDVVTGAYAGGTVDTDEDFAVKVGVDSTGAVTGYATDENGDVVTVTTPFVTATAQATANEFEGAATADPLAALDTALSTVDSLRSDLGAIQNRFDSAITNLATTETNLTAARSRIQDADYATEVSNMTRNQILQQAGTSILAQANQLPQSVLSLLG